MISKNKILNEFTDALLNEDISKKECVEVLFDRLMRLYPDVITRHGHEVVGDMIIDTVIENFDTITSEKDVKNLLPGVLIKLSNTELDEGQIYAQGGGYGEGQRWYKPKDDLGESEELDEDLRKWFREKWVRFGPDGKIRGSCARGDDSEGKPKCLPQAKAHALGKKGRKYAASKKRREDPNPERRGPAKNVATKKKSNESLREFAPPNGDSGDDGFSEETLKMLAAQWWNNDEDPKIEKTLMAAGWEIGQDEGYDNGGAFVVQAGDVNGNSYLSWPAEELEQLNELKCWPGYTRVQGVPAGAPGSCKKKTSEEKIQMFTPEEKCPHCGGPMFEETMMNEKKDACYYKVKSRYKVWPSAYASGALVQCRKKGASNWGTKSEGVEEAINPAQQAAIAIAMKKAGKKPKGESAIMKGIVDETLGTPYPGTYEQETDPFKSKGQKRTQSIAFEDEQLDEKWSEKYKRSIDCSNPKGFSQRAHCQGRKK